MSASAPYAPDTLIDARYRVERPLGVGGMGAVYAVVDEGTGAHIALKQLAPESGKRAHALFEQEYRVLAALRHPCIVRAYEFGVENGSPYYTMELLEGGDLSTAAPTPWREVCATLRDAASILGVLHARRMVHRDISPRNLWRTPEGRIKLLDFGAMASFGAQTIRIGTPPYMPPEAVRDGSLDGRSDLYALGALGYWLLTTTHAYKARSSDELPALWLRAPAPPSQLVALIDGADHSVPKELDALLLALLSLEPDARPASTTDVIDRLNHLAGLTPEAEAEVVHGYLESKAFVGRRGELEVLEAQFQLAKEGVPTATFVGGSEGVGRSRLLEEAAMSARVLGATAVALGRAAGHGPYAGATALGLTLLRALPVQAREAAAPVQEVLASLSGALGSALRGAAEADCSAQVIDRGEKQKALQRWVASLARQRPLVILVDDVQLLDEESQALFVALAMLERGHQLSLVVSACTDTAPAVWSPLHTLQRTCRTLPLAALAPEETFELLRSTFNDVPYLERLAARLHRASHGNPRHCLLLAEQLVHTKVIQYAEGAFQLPRELPDVALPEELSQGILGTIDRLSAPARRLARCLAVPDHGELTLAMVVAAGGVETEEARACLDELVRRRVLEASASSYSFVHAASREQLCAELSSDERQRVHRAMALHLEAQAGANALVALRAGVHWLRAGEVSRAEPLIFKAGMTHTQAISGEALRQAAPMFAECDRLYRALGRDDHALYLPLGALALASYFVDQQYAREYGERAIATLSQGVGLSLANRLERWLGRRFALIVSLIVAGVRLRRRPFAPDLKRLIYVLVASATALGGCAAATLDPESVRRHTAVLRTLSLLKSADAARMLADFNEAMALNVEGKSHAAQALLTKVIGDLEAPGALPSMTAAARRNYLAGAIGIHAAHDLGIANKRCLASADKMEKFGGVHAVWANQVRAMYYMNMGQAERASHYRRQVELGAIQLGTAWQVEAWRAPVQIVYFSEDAAACKHMADEMERLSSTAPSFGELARWNRAAYLVLRGRYDDALALYKEAAEPSDLLGALPAQSWFAAAMNGLGAHERARACCLGALARVTPEDRARMSHTLRLEVELAIAEAGLGDLSAAHARMSDLFARHTPHTGPVVLGYLHGARARLCLLAGDVEGYERAVDAAADAYAPLDVPSLHERIATMRRMLAKQTAGAVALDDGSSDSHLLTRAQLRLANVTVANDTRRQQSALRVALELAHADTGFIVRTSGKSVAPRGKPMIPEVVRWAESQLRQWSQDEATAVLDTPAANDQTAGAAETLTHAGVTYRAQALWSSAGEPLAALVLGCAATTPAPLPRKVLAVLTEHLQPSGESASSSGVA